MRYSQKYITVLALTICLVLFSISCSEKENQEYPAPSISFKTTEGYIYSDTTLALDQTVLMGLEASTSSTTNLTHLHIDIQYDDETTSLDSGFSSATLDYNRSISKSSSEQETWSFYVRDTDGRQSDTLSFTLFKSAESEYGAIKRYENVILGAQGHPNTGGFFSASDGTIYNLGDAFLNQAKIDLVYYYDIVESDKNTLASAGANIDNSIFPGSSGLENWTTKNTARFILADEVSTGEFSAAANDSLILFNSFEFDAGKRKAKKLQAGDIYSFVTDSGIKGMFKVNTIDGQETGTIDWDIIVQD
jgi:hypothetical protein